MAKYFGMTQMQLILLLVIVGGAYWGTGGFTHAFSLAPAAITPGPGQQPAGPVVAGTFSVTIAGAGISEIDGKSGEISVGAEGCSEQTKTTDLRIRTEESLKTSQGTITYVGGTYYVFDAGTKQQIETGVLSDGGTSTTTDPTCGQSVYVIVTNASDASAKFGPFTVGGARTILRGVVDVAGVPTLQFRNESGAWTTNTNTSVGASTTSKNIEYRLLTTTARGIVLDPAMAISADLTSNFTAFAPTRGTEVGCPIRLAAQTQQELKCFGLGLGRTVSVNANSNADSFTITSGALDPIQGAVDANSLAVAVTAYDQCYYLLNTDLAGPAGQTNTNADVCAADATGYIAVA